MEDNEKRRCVVTDLMNLFLHVTTCQRLQAVNCVAGLVLKVLGANYFSVTEENCILLEMPDDFPSLVPSHAV